MRTEPKRISGDLMPDVKQQTTGRHFFELVSIAICTVAFLFTALSVLVVVLGRQAAANRDYIEYWASGQQLVHHKNPYDATAILKLEHSEGFPSGLQAMVMGNAPPALVLTYPLGFVGANAGQYIWMSLLVAGFVLSVRLMCDALGSTTGYVYILGYSFAPALACIAAGQMAMLVLFGLVLFLRFHQSSPWLAGAALWFCFLKPQLFLPFAAVLCLWAWSTRQFKIIGGAMTAASISSAVVFAIDPNCWAQYGQMMKIMRYDKISIPCISMALRDSLPGGAFVQYAPAVLGCVWALRYFWRHRFEWRWIEHGSLLLLVSLLVAPYTWFVDQCVALPALLRGLHVTRSRTLVALLALAGAIIEIALLAGRELLHSKFYLWTAPAWLLWYVVACPPAREEERSGTYKLGLPLTESSEQVNASRAADF
jgi:hypothetical protein